MSAPRIHIPPPLTPDSETTLPVGAFRHLVQVLRLGAGDALTVFDGVGGEYPAQLSTVNKRDARVRLGARQPCNRESPLRMTLVQGVSKGERMDWTLQKAVELGAAAVLPVITQRCNVRLDGERWQKKMDHWRGIMISACEQSGRNRLPDLLEVQTLAQYLEQPRDDGLSLTLAPGSGCGLRELAPAGRISLLIGPEGGLSDAEIAHSLQRGFVGIEMGPRILRTETAGIAALAAIGALWGDLGAGSDSLR